MALDWVFEAGAAVIFAALHTTSGKTQNADTELRSKKRRLVVLVCIRGSYSSYKSTDSTHTNDVNDYE